MPDEHNGIPTEPHYSPPLPKAKIHLKKDIFKKEGRKEGGEEKQKKGREGEKKGGKGKRKH
jgi:hypothetical protein